MVQTPGRTQRCKFLQVSHIQIAVTLIHFRDKFCHFRGRITTLKIKIHWLILIKLGKTFSQMATLFCGVRLFRNLEYFFRLFISEAISCLLGNY